MGMRQSLVLPPYYSETFQPRFGRGCATSSPAVCCALARPAVNGTIKRVGVKNLAAVDVQWHVGKLTTSSGNTVGRCWRRVPGLGLARVRVHGAGPKSGCTVLARSRAGQQPRWPARTCRWTSGPKQVSCAPHETTRSRQALAGGCGDAA